MTDIKIYATILSMNYIELLKQSASKTQNCACMGLDPQIEFLPDKSGDVKKDIVSFFSELFLAMKENNLIPAAFKPNVGYYSALDKPREGNFIGSQALADIMDLLQTNFPSVPIIFDSKRGDIARSSLNYAVEAFDGWKADAVTVSPYMGSDSILPFIDKNYLEKGAYILNRTSNPGGKDFQNFEMKNSQNENEALYKAVAKSIAGYAKDFPGTGAVVGATGISELKDIAEIFVSTAEVPLLIPGVGSQGGSASEVLSVLKNAGYDLKLVRINSSSALTHPWKNTCPPKNYLTVCLDNIQKLLEETKI